MGLSVATHLVSQGWNVCIVDFNETSGQEVAERLGKQAQGQDHVQFVKVDVTDYEQQAKAFVETWARWGRLDFVFANAVCCALSSSLFRAFYPLSASFRLPLASGFIRQRLAPGVDAVTLT